MKTDAPRKFCSARKRSVSGKCLICSESKATATMFYLCESEAAATKRPVGTEIHPTLCLRFKVVVSLRQICCKFGVVY
ncbi:hypothetical protein [Lysinibacillus sphaericus]|uniref:hypothetical protein n=1 Tax=Lysinibacillus sphaericus TaxID=1421 RepID=UPI001CBAB745|nr:hypothetical protein [Lysinibacillus sphaericus]